MNDNLEDDVNFYENEIDSELVEIIRHDIDVAQRRFGAKVINGVVFLTVDSDEEDDDFDEVDYTWWSENDEDGEETDYLDYEPLDPPDDSRYDF